MRKTEQRSAILRELQKRKDHPTAYDIYHTVRCSMPNISLGTVYRNLEYLAGKGMIRKIDSAGGKKRFDPNTQDHPHFHCLECDRVEDIPAATMPCVPDAGNDWPEGRIILGINLEYVGLCSSCAGRKTAVGHEGD